MSLAEWVGCVVSIDCGDVLGTYQGHVSDVDQETQSISIMKGFRNGIKCVVPRITINAQDIKDLKIIKQKIHHDAEKEKPMSRKKTGTPNKSPDLMEINHNTPKKGPSDRCMNRGASPAKHNGYSHSNQNGPLNGLTPSKHTKHDNGFAQNGFHDNGNQQRMNGTPNKWDNQTEPRRRTNSESEYRDRRKQASTPRKIENFQNGAHRGGRSRGPQWDDTFSAPMNSFDDDFDIQKNLELFDKKAVFQAIENSGVVKVVKAGPKQPANYRHDENVLCAAPVMYRQIKVPQATGQEYVTDCGLVVPAVGYPLRQRLFDAAEHQGLSTERQLEMIGRSACEMVMQLLGGAHRLTPKNAHQRPQVVVLCGPHIQGAMGVNCARQLASHGVGVTLFVPKFLKLEDRLESELQLFELSNGIKTSNAKDLPSLPVEMVINTMDSHEARGLEEQAWYRGVVGWTRQCKAPILALDPPVSGGVLDPKWSLGIGLPLPLSEKCGQVYLADMGLPSKVFTKVGIKYMSPFGHKFHVALHPNVMPEGKVTPTAT